MANVYAIKSGNWSDPTAWNTGALPTAADVVRPNGFIVEVDGTYTVTQVRNDASSPSIGGGRFNLNNGCVLNCTASPGVFGALQDSPTVVFNLPTGNTATINSSVYANQINCVGVIAESTATGTLNINGEVSGGIGNTGSDANAVRINGSIVANIVGNVFGNSAGAGIDIRGSAIGAKINVTGNIFSGSGGYQNRAIVVSVYCEVTVVGSVFGAEGNSAHPTIDFAAGTLTVVGNIASANNVAVSSGSSISLNHTGTAQASTSQPAISSTSGSAINILSGPLISNAGMVPFYGPKLFLKGGAPSQWAFTTQNLLEDRTLYTADSINNQPAAADVRLGTSYANGDLTGTCAMPPASSVRAGVPVDNTVGTGALTAEDIWSALVSGMDVTGSIGERLKNAATVQTVGDQWAAE